MSEDKSFAVVTCMADVPLPSDSMRRSVECAYRRGFSQGVAEVVRGMAKPGSPVSWEAVDKWLYTEVMAWRYDGLLELNWCAPRFIPEPEPNNAAISLSSRQAILRRDACQCQMCGASPPDVTLHIDHRVPVSRGGTNEPDNLWVLCKECNLGKGNRWID